MKKISLLLLLLTAVRLSAAPVQLPVRILSGYTGMHFDNKKDFRHVKKMVAELGRYGFNSIEIKFRNSGTELVFDQKYTAIVREIYELCRANGLIMQVYIYTLPHHGIRNPELPAHRTVPCPVDNLGNKVENAFLLTDVRSWQELYKHAYSWLELRKKIPFAALKFDIERVSRQYSYDDKTWADFCKKYPRFQVSTPAAKRAKVIAMARFVPQYQDFFHGEVEKAVKAWFADLRSKDPDVVFGYMPSKPDRIWLTPIFERNMATDTVPAICDGWDMYGGAGYVEKIKEHEAIVRKFHPNNIFIPWNRPNSYLKDDIAPGIYHAASNHRGYSIWTLTMLDDKRAKKVYALPGNGKWKAADYLQEFARANNAIRADIADGTIGKAKRIANRKPQALVAPLDLAPIKTRDLLPAGNGSGKDKSFILRRMQIIHIYANAGENLWITLKHPNPSRRISITYALFDRNKNILYQESLTPGATINVRAVAPHTGTYTFVVEPGACLTWYEVTVHNRYYAFEAGQGGTYLFGSQTIYVPGKDLGNPELFINMLSGAQSHIRKINDSQAVINVRKSQSTEKLPEGIVKVEFSDYKASGTYTQDFVLSFPKGEYPLIFGHPERRLIFKK